MKFRLCILAAAAVASCGLSANADIVTTFSTDGTVATSPSNTDLFQTDLLSSTFPINTNIANGSTGTSGENSGENPASSVAPGLYEFVLDTSVNTSGYDITSIAGYSGWVDQRAGQEYTVSFRTVGSSTFTPIATVNEVVIGTSLVTTVFDDQGALLATGVDAIQFDVGANGAAGGGENNVWREIDAFGTATVAVPEPASMALLGLGAIGLIGRRRRR